MNCNSDNFLKFQFDSQTFSLRDKVILNLN
jgi:hypothetical protein